MKDIKLRHSDLKTIKKEKLKDIIRKWDSEKWKDELGEKSSLLIYSHWKKRDAGRKHHIWQLASINNPEARTNNLILNDRNRLTNEDTKCIFCDRNIEDLKHILLWCPGYANIRKKSITLQRLNIEEENVIGQLLFEENRIQENEEIVYEMWMKRRSQRKNLLNAAN